MSNSEILKLAAKLIEMVKAETPSAEMMKKKRFKTSTQLKAY
jgi:hypothetical protein